MIHASPADIHRFMDFVDVLPNGCWFYMGARSRGKDRGKKAKWYGSFSIGKIVVRAHRFSCEVFKGELCPPGYHRDHTCCFSLCVNPDHIVIVPAKVNGELKMERIREAQKLETDKARRERLIADHIQRMKYFEREMA